MSNDVKLSNLVKLKKGKKKIEKRNDGQINYKILL